MSCGMKHLKLSVAEKSNILWRRVKEKYIWGTAAHEHMYSLSIWYLMYVMALQDPFKGNWNCKTACKSKGRCAILCTGM